MPQPLSLTAVQPHVDAVIAHYTAKVRQAATQGAPVNWIEVLTNLVGTLRSVFGQTTAPAPTQEQAIVTEVTNFYTTVLEPILASTIQPSILFTAVIDPMIKMAIPMIVQGVYTALTNIVTTGPLPPVTPAAPGSTGLPPGWQPY